jgi:hypothetical protein
MTFVETYVANCRAVHNLREPAITCLVGGVATLVASAIGALNFGLNGVAVAWLAAECGMGLWALWRLRATISFGYEPQVRVLEPGQHWSQD